MANKRLSLRLSAVIQYSVFLAANVYIITECARLDIKEWGSASLSQPGSSLLVDQLLVSVFFGKLRVSCGSGRHQKQHNSRSEDFTYSGAPLVIPELEVRLVTDGFVPGLVVFLFS